jgi:hypothetical protein
MVNFTTASQRHQLEQQWSQPTKKYPFFSRISAQFYVIFQQVIQTLIASDQPRVWQIQHHGTSYWNAYDPVSQCRVEGLSDSEMRAWLEHRYNR